MSETSTTTNLNRKEAAEYLRCSSGALSNWERLGKGPRRYKLGKLVRYRKSDLEAWLAEQAVETNK
jgi:excisionase family DNA binding protein